MGFFSLPGELWRSSGITERLAELEKGLLSMAIGGVTVYISYFALCFVQVSFLCV